MEVEYEHSGFSVGMETRYKIVEFVKGSAVSGEGQNYGPTATLSPATGRRG